MEIGGKIYFCPERSIAVALQLIFLSPSFMSDYDRQRELSQNTLLEYLNDAAFMNYHFFRSESHICPATAHN